MVDGSLITSLRSSLRLWANATSCPGIRVFVFGSATYSEAPSDFDIAIVYDDQLLDVRAALSIRASIVEALGNLGRPIDAVLLSDREERELQFTTTEGAVALL